MRRVSTLVLPEPAPATMSSDWPAVLDGLALLRVEAATSTVARIDAADGGRLGLRTAVVEFDTFR